MRIRAIRDDDIDGALTIINQAARAYRGVIPADRWHEPYMPRDELMREIADGVVFWIAEDDEQPVGVMGIQDRIEVALIRHAYIAPTTQRRGVGTALLRHVSALVSKPILIGTWADASWAIDFYRRNGFTVVSGEEKDSLLRRFWSIPERQIETSVVLADARWTAQTARARILAFMRTHSLAVQASVSPQGQPQAASVGIVISDDFEILFDTVETTRKAENLRKDPRIALVIGGMSHDEERSVQFEGIVDEPRGQELERFQQLYFQRFPDGRERLKWPGLIYFRARPTWLRFSDFTRDPPEIIELDVSK